MYEPEPLPLTFDEIKRTNPSGHKILTHLIDKFSLKIYRENEEVRKLGLEKATEIVYDLYLQGNIKVIYDEDTQETYMGSWDRKTGKYTTNPVED